MSNFDFEEAEYEARYARTRELMANNGLDAIVVSQEPNYIYYTGHRSDQNKVDRARPYIFILPLVGEPIVMTMGFEQGHISACTYIKNTRPFGFFEHLNVLKGVLMELGLESKAIGWELGRETQLGLGFTVNDYLELKAEMPKASFMDASNVLLPVRAVKSPAEIAYMRRSATAASDGIDKAFSQVKVGMTERDVFRLVGVAIAEENNGEGPTDMRVLSGKDHTGLNMNMFPTDRVLEVGDTLTVDSGTRVAGYGSDIARTAIIGKASDIQRETYEWVYDLNHLCYDKLRVGNMVGDAAAVAREEIAKSGRPYGSPGRIGHGVGLDCLEYPSLREGDPIMIEEGMVFACNPNFALEHGAYNVEENLVVTAAGPEKLAERPALRDVRILG